MESTHLDMDDLFDCDDNDDREDYGMHAGLPDLDIDGVISRTEHQSPDEREEDEVLANLKNLSRGAAKKKVQRPQPKLDAERLKSDRGLPALTNLFSAASFGGKGHEVEDLKLLMSRVEHWAHRLFPKMSFNDFIERMEKLGAKKEIQTCVKRIRLDMPVTNNDQIQNPDDKEPDHESLPPNISDDDDVMKVEMAYDDVMVVKEIERQPTDSALCCLNPRNSSPIPQLTQSPNSSTVLSLSSSAKVTFQSVSSQLITLEQQNRMEHNRMIAVQKRAQRLGQSLPISAETLISQEENSSKRLCC